MGLFGTWGTKDPTTARFDQLMEELAEVKRQLALIKGERSAVGSLRSMEVEYAETKQKLTDLQIEFDKEKEKHEREKRETEHLVGLERKRSEFEASKAATEATIAVREENLKADRDRFEENLKFNNERFTTEVGYLKEMVGEMLERLPKVDVAVKAGGNGTQKEAAPTDDA